MDEDVYENYDGAYEQKNTFAEIAEQQYHGPASPAFTLTDILELGFYGLSCAVTLAVFIFTAHAIWRPEKIENKSILRLSSLLSFRFIQLPFLIYLIVIFATFVMATRGIDDYIIIIIFALPVLIISFLSLITLILSFFTKRSFQDELVKGLLVSPILGLITFIICFAMGVGLALIITPFENDGLYKTLALFSVIALAQCLCFLIFRFFKDEKVNASLFSIKHLLVTILVAGIFANIPLYILKKFSYPEDQDIYTIHTIGEPLLEGPQHLLPLDEPMENKSEQSSPESQD